MRKFASILVLAATAFTSALADDWPQLFGADQTGISKEKLNKNWSSEGFKPLWTVPLAGWGSFAVAGDKAYTLTTREFNGEMREILIALDAATGKELWMYDIEKTSGKYYKHRAHQLNGGAGSGPGSTPTVSDGRVYAYSTDLKLVCLDAKTGEKIWLVDIAKEHGGGAFGQMPRYGNTSSPTVDGDLVFVAGGGSGQSLLAFDKATGKLAWKAEDMEQSYATARAATIDGVRQIIFYLKNDLIGVSAKDGKRLWRTSVPFFSNNDTIPTVFENKVYAGSAASRGGALYEINKTPDREEGEDEYYAEQIYKTKTNESPCLTNVVLLDGHLYGKFSGEGGERLKCIEFATGKVVWEEKLAKDDGVWNSVILVDGKLLILLDDGKLILADPSPAGYKELARFKALEGKCWSTAAFSNGRLFLRSNKEGVAYDLSAK